MSRTGAAVAVASFPAASSVFASRRQRGEGDRRAQIAMAAAELFAEYGYETTTVRQIADRVGMLAGSLYNHFATKEDMLHAVMRARIEQLERDNLVIARLPVDAEHRLLANAILRMRDYGRYWPFHAILLRESRYFERTPDFAYVVEAKAHISAVQQAIVEEGVKARLFRPGMDAYLIIGAISRMLSGITLWQRSTDRFRPDPPSSHGPDMLVDFHFECILRLVRPPDRLGEPVPRAECERLLDDAFGEDWLESGGEADIG
ncbi:TetR/AcrR family transcriptional regulator [Sphingobium sufflavum]|uniref:TetR/AcrR family transcriptional regulator n=1 Tax=Sphingobium sufflavum TaxID=1129547 RepID=UPI001F38AB52|nr:TetR/AcrR family transcriptional regulator [Sphingobium sufflavum]MCE7796319.1 TetR/AcrR family transcriptional regulator [Sphingobium sufflavum]